MRVFISYKWEDDAHNRWVKGFATDLRAAGIDAILDQWEVRLGDSLIEYMTSRIKEADAVLFIITTRSVAAAEARKGDGGFVKFEIQMATSRRIAGEQMRLIGVFREGKSTPMHLRDHRYADFRSDSEYESRLKELVDDLLGRDSRPRLFKPIHSPESPSLPLIDFETLTLDKNGYIAERRKGRVQCLTESFNGVRLEMILIPAGRFLMGEPGKARAGIFSDLAMPQHWVTIARPFFIGRYLVTQEQYLALMGVNQSRFHGTDLPVESVSWHDAVEFCSRLSSTTRKEYRLPSEAEWEYACRAGTSTPFSFGETITTEFANFNGAKTTVGSQGVYRDRTTPAGSFGVANGFGLTDMHGNLSEWCMDVWHNNYREAPTDGAAWMGFQNDWETATEHTQRVMRSGPWYEGSGNSMSFARHGVGGSIRRDGHGFRVVTSVHV